MCFAIGSQHLECWGQRMSRIHDKEPGVVWYGMVDVCEGAPVAVSGWVLVP